VNLTLDNLVVGLFLWNWFQFALEKSTAKNQKQAFKLISKMFDFLEKQTSFYA
jgi:hypothetical protein